MIGKSATFGPSNIPGGPTNLVAPAAAGASAVGYTATADYIIIRHVRVVNKTGGNATVSFYKGASSAAAAGTEVIGSGQSVLANSSFDWYGFIRLEGSNGFLVGEASAGVTLIFTAEGEIGHV